MQLSKQPLTHSILRNSQSRRHSSRPDQQSQQKLKQNDKNIKNKNYNQRLFNYQYSRSWQSRQSNGRVNFNTGDSFAGNVHFSIHKSQYEIKQRRQNIVVCQSLPKTRPKYSFTFSNGSSQHNNHKQQSQLNVNKIIINKYNRTPNVQPNNQNTQRPLSSQVQHQVNSSQQQQQQYQQQQQQQYQRQQQPQYQRQQDQLTSRCRNIRKDIDICLYTIADKLNQQRQFQQQSSKQMKYLVASKLGSPQQLKYKPSFSQLRKNKKMFLDKSIHRIHPQIVQQYIETVYREYNIPNVMRGGQQQVRVSEKVYDRESMRQQRRYIVNKQQINKRIANNIQLNQQFLAKKQQLTKIPLQKQQQQRVSFQTRQSQQLQKQQNMTTQTQPIYRSQYIIHNKKYVRKNNLISQKQLTKSSINKKQKRRFLNLTLSKQKQEKMLKTINKFQSPNKKVDNNKQQGVRKQQQSRQSSKSSKSQSVKKSKSQRKIMQIKKNIADWRDSQHQFAQRYSYLQSPYEIIRGKQQQYKIKQQQSSREVNIVVRPFEEMMKVSISKQEKQQIPHAIKTVTTQYITNPTSSQYHNQQQSKYIHSFFTNSEGQIPQQFRYCPLCQQQVLTVNLMKHQQKCIGWIDDCGQLVMFKELYMMDDEKLGELMHVKIKEIQKRVQKFVQKLRLKQQQTAKQQTQNLNTKILRSVEEFIHSYTLLQQNPINLTTKYLLASNYNSLNKISKNDQSFILLEETRKLYWFVGLLESYQNRRKNLIKNKPNTYKSQQIQKYNQSKGDNNVSTMARHNQSVNFIQQQNKNTHVSEFVGVRNSTF